MAATTIKGKQKVCSHRSQTLEKGERSKHTEKGGEARARARACTRWGQEGGKRRKEREKGNRRSERHREERINIRENTFLAPGLYKEILVPPLDFLEIPC